MVARRTFRTSTRGIPAPEHPDLDQTIVRIISDEGDAAFSTILRDVKSQFSVSRETVARRLARMLRFSQIVRLRHGHYTVGSASTPPSTLLRMRAVHVNEVLSLDGSSDYQLEKEFLVLSGRCDHITSQVAPTASMRARGWDLSGSRRVRMITYTERGRTTLVARFTPAIPTGPWVPHRLVVSLPFNPHYYAMQRTAEAPARRSSPLFPQNRHTLGVLSNPEPGTIVETSKDTILDMRVHFPRGFPRGAIHPRVAAILSGKIMIAEARALVKLSKETRGALGLTVHDDLVTLRIKNPLIDCFYGFTWVPPKDGTYTKWVHRLLASGRGHATKFVS